MTPAPHGAAIVAIGNELLSGKIADTNTPFLLRELRDLGLPVREVRTIADDIETIGATFREVAPRFEVVLSSGGVGPTHDDVTLVGLARAFGVPVVRDPELAAAIAAFYGPATNEAVLRMADLPEGTTLLRERGLIIPVVLVRNVYVLPGEPTIFKKKFLAVRERFRRDPFHLRKIFLDADESEIALALEEAERGFGVAVGSYPRYDAADYRVMVTVESKDAARVEAATRGILDAIPAKAVLRVE
jgi:molybdenum cofactor synthesis domain-containing protein